MTGSKKKAARRRLLLLEPAKTPDHVSEPPPGAGASPEAYATSRRRSWRRTEANGNALAWSVATGGKNPLTRPWNS